MGEQKQGTTGATWNVIEAEDRLQPFYSIAKMITDARNKGGNMSAEDIRFPFQNESVPYFNAAINEMADIMSGRDKQYQYHLNRIADETPVFRLFKNNGKSYKISEMFDTEEEAKAAAESMEDAYVENNNLKVGKKFAVWELDEQDTADMRKNHHLGEYIGDYDTEDEAKEAGDALGEDYYIEDGIANEMWAVISNDTGSNVFGMLFPTMKRAFAFMYHESTPPAWAEMLRHEEERRNNGTEGEA